MPAGYEVMVGRFQEDFERAGHPPEKALEMAKTKAAKIWNSMHPENPVHPGYDKQHS